MPNFYPTPTLCVRYALWRYGTLWHPLRYALWRYGPCDGRRVMRYGVMGLRWPLRYGVTEPGRDPLSKLT